ncbi:MAG: isoaspartyl peptidase/L-asparaginase [Planctomycetes bacterium]|nr:isoaspartyl peptidase/L-asparaginase [Planctomycetota bacterium]MCB9828700.1 isoaspartyl peptidase/L-asparaginase [Planctomycetota bacterium]MCB9901064.1 isoaspartyl peptidase/L-asparaginase [Planctomycetota bacterium]
MQQPPPRRKALIVHGGAWDIPVDERPEHERAVRAAVDAGWAVLAAGGEAFEAVVAAVAVLEDEPVLNAGRGAVLNRRGEVELDAGLMDGRRLHVGAVAGVRRLAHPIRAAQAMLRERPVLLYGEGAETFARAAGLDLVEPASLVTPREEERLATWLARERERGEPSPAGGNPADTVGAVALDGEGGIAAGTSTGGTLGKPPGRIGDAPVPGAGYFADHLAGGAATTGHGEAILRHGTARRAVELGREGNNAVDACWLVVRELEDRWGGRGGLVMLGRDGTIGYAFNTPAMAIGWRDDETPETVVAGLTRRG